MLERRKLDTHFFDRPVDEVARSLIGCILFTNFDGMRTGGRMLKLKHMMKLTPRHTVIQMHG